MTRATWGLTLAVMCASMEAHADSRRLVLEAHEALLSGSTLNLNLTTDLVAKPVSLAPSIYYGVSSSVTIGITHDQGTTLFTPRPGIRTASHSVGGTTLVATSGDGVCVSGSSHGCPDTYNNVGFDTLGTITEGTVDVAAHIGLDFLTLSDPRVIQLRIGALGRYRISDKVALTYDPRVELGLTQRDSGNTERLDVPVWAWFLINPEVGVYASTGFAAELEEVGTSYTIPFGVGASFTLCRVTLGADLLLTNVAGKAHSFDGRELGLRAAYSF